MKQLKLKSGKPFTVAEACPGDAEEILHYLNAVGGESDNLLFGKDDFQMPLERERGFIESVAKDEKSLMLLGRADGMIVSVSSLSGFSARERIAHRAEIAVSVRKEYWNLGIGTAVMRELMDYARSHGIEVLQLTVRADNFAAVHVYEKLGFEKVGLYKRYFKIGESYYDAFLMNLYF